MSHVCMELHVMSNQMKRHLDVKEIPRNGIYILFENDEHRQGMDRIVRIGTHMSNNQLRISLIPLIYVYHTRIEPLGSLLRGQK